MYSAPIRVAATYGQDDPTYCIFREKLCPELQKSANQRLFVCPDDKIGKVPQEPCCHQIRYIVTKLQRRKNISHIMKPKIDTHKFGNNLAMALKLPVRKAELPQASSTLKSD